MNQPGWWSLFQFSANFAPALNISVFAAMAPKAQEVDNKERAMCVNTPLSHKMNNKYICDLQIVDIYQNIRPGRAIVLRKLLS